MKYIKKYQTPPEFSDMFMSSDGIYLTGLWFENSSDQEKHQDTYQEEDLEIFRETSLWLDIYLSGKQPDFIPKYKIENLTPFREKVINIMNKIPYGKTITYNDIAKEIAKEKGLKKMSAQAVGGAVGWNPICLIIPCHRVIGANNNITGYGGGINNKLKLLELEQKKKVNLKFPKSKNQLNTKDWSKSVFFFRKYQLFLLLML